MTTKNKEERDILRPLTDKELEELLQLYERKYGLENFQYFLIYNQCKWNRKLEELNIDEQNECWISFRKDFYTHVKGDFRKYGTYICLHQDLTQSISFHSWEPHSFTELIECLNETKLIHWKSGPLFINVAPEYSEEVKKIVLNKGVTIHRARSCQGLILTHAEALSLTEVKLPQGYQLAELQEKHADLIHSLWANNKEGSLEYIKGLIKINKSIGLFEESTNSLVGWIFQNEFSGLGILQVLPSEQRKGFGTILAEALSNIIAKSESINITAWVVVGNVKSETLLQKVGFRKAVIYEWIQLDKCK